MGNDGCSNDNDGCSNDNEGCTNDQRASCGDLCPDGCSNDQRSSCSDSGKGCGGATGDQIAGVLNYHASCNFALGIAFLRHFIPETISWEKKGPALANPSLLFFDAGSCILVHAGR